MYFLDTNIFLHLIFPKVDRVKHANVVALFEKAALGEISLWTTEWVVAELIWFLGRKNFNWKKIQQSMLEDVFGTKGLEVRGRKWLEEVIEKAKKPTDFVDLVNLEILAGEKVKYIYSYDHGFDKYKGFKRLEP